ncbi:unnamed protein product, partial [Polarella glacialis]
MQMSSVPYMEPALELDVQLSPRLGRDVRDRESPTVVIEEREDVGRFLRVSRAIHRGEAILVEDPLFLSPSTNEEVQELVAATCDAAATAAAAEAAAASGSVVASSSTSPPATNLAAEACGSPASWLPVPEQLVLAIVQAFLIDQNSDKCESFRLLRGDTERWRESAARLWSLLREDVKSNLSFEALCEIYSIVASNAHQSDGGRAGVFNLGSYMEHSCSPTAFKEVVVPLDFASRPGSPSCSPSRGSDSPPSSPMLRKSPSWVGGAVPSMTPTPQLVVRAHRDLAEGDIVSIAYIPLYEPTWMRRAALQTGYGFHCRCDRCERDSEVVCAFNCPECGGGPCSPTGPVAAANGDLTGQGLRCESCGELLRTEDAELFSAVEASE